MSDHYVAMSGLLAAYIMSNLIAAIRMRAFTMGRSSQRRVIDILAFLLCGSVIVAGLGLMALTRRFDEWAQ
jgi:hypothetical protein